jgi:hypothetical protein
VHIVAYCPHCRSRYQLKPELSGQTIQCPNRSCGQVFQVREEAGDGGQQPASARPSTGSVGEIVPLVPAVPTSPPIESAAEVSDWNQPPPVRRPASIDTYRPEPAAKSKSSIVLPPDQLNPPASPTVSPVAPDSTPVPGSEPPISYRPVVTSSQKRRRAKWLVGAIVIALVGSMAGVVGYYLSTRYQSEVERFARAKQLYADEKYEEAANAFDSLAKDIPDSEHLDEYSFFRELAHIWSHAKSAQSDPEEVLRQLDAFVKDYSRNPTVFDPNRQSVSGAYVFALDQLVAEVQTALGSRNLEQARQLHAAGVKARKTLEQLGSKSVETAQLDQQFASMALGIDKLARRLQSLTGLEKLDPTLDNLRRARQMVRSEGLEGESRAQNALRQIQDGILGTIKYEQAERRLNPLHEDNVEPSILMAVAEHPSAVARMPGEDIVFALARGVLYALGAKSSEVYWATRVGLDTMTLPVRVAATESTPEIALVLSSDSGTLVARELQNGTPRWQYALPAPCLGRPVLVGQTAYVATTDGWVREIEVISGRLLGSFNLNAPLSGFGTCSQNLLYLPAESMGVFVLDLESKRCTGLLETDHASGSVRGEPVIVGADKYLVLSQADGLRHTALAAYRLPINGFSNQPPDVPPLRFNGWNWFAPAFDGEKLSMVTDRGVLQVFGVKQPNNQDLPIFTMFDASPSNAEGSIDAAERGQIVHADEHNFWALVHGELARYELGWDRTHGLRLVPAWHHPLAIGSPIQASQTAGSTDALVMVTQSDSECLATAVTAKEGLVLWQKRLGLVCRGEPRLVGQHLIAVDHGGAMASFAPGSELPPLGREWRQGGNNIFGPLSKITSGPFLLEDRKGGIWEIATTTKTQAAGVPGDSEVVVRHYDDSANQGEEHRFPIPDHIQGTPAIGATEVWLPLNNGEIYQQPLGGVGRLTVSWRSDPNSKAPGHLVMVDDSHLISTDGQRTVTLWKLPAGGGFPEPVKSKKLPARITTAPVVLPGSGDKARLCLVDERGFISLLQPINLQVTRTWNSGGYVSAGPYIRGAQMLCIVGQRRLVAIDPQKEGLIWAAEPTSHAIVGEPVQMGDGYLLADESGHYVMIDALTGRPRGQSLQVRGSLGPAATPVAYGNDRIFAPLTDGTFMLLRLEGAQQAKR